MNMQVQLAATDRHPIVQLTNGQYHAGGDPAAVDYADVRLVADHVAFGDLNGDGAQDAAALMSENYGGTGVFVSVIAVLNTGGRPVQAGAALVDDRPQVIGLVISDRRILFRGNVHGPNDPGCCAALPVSEGFGLYPSGLQLVFLTSGGVAGTQRRIVNESPVSGSQAQAGPVQVKGSVTVAPFENTLALHVFDGTGKELLSGSIPVSASGSFDSLVNLSSLPAGMPVRLAISDVSAADGSTIALDSTELMIK